MRNGSSTFLLLGYAGLVPFVVPALALALDIEHRLLSAAVINGYAFGIVSFLCGSWWGMAISRGNSAPLWLSNALFLIAFFVYVFATAWWPLTACVLLLTLIAIEHGSAILPPMAPDYRRLRTILTLIAAGSMLVVQFAG